MSPGSVHGAAEVYQFDFELLERDAPVLQQQALFVDLFHQQDVLRFDVCVHDGAPVDEAERLDYLRRDAPHVRQRKRPEAARTHDLIEVGSQQLK